MNKPSRLPLYLGALLVAAGWAVLVVGWYQAGRQDLETGQIPYVLSGGFGGFGLLAMGAAAVVIDVIRQAEWRAFARLEELRSSLAELASSLEQPSRRAERGGNLATRRPRRRG